jgi:hypothetical protein
MRRPVLELAGKLKSGPGVVVVVAVVVVVVVVVVAESGTVVVCACAGATSASTDATEEKATARPNFKRMMTTRAVTESDMKHAVAKRLQSATL